LVAVLKPVETGCMKQANELVPADALRLAEAAGRSDRLDCLCPNRYPLPASPEAAANDAHRPVNVPAIFAARDSLVAGADLLIIEGAGGLLVPMAPGLQTADLVVQLAAPLLVVGRASLGTINHTLLTLEAARHRGIRIAGVVLNRVSSTSGPDEPTNPGAIARHGAVPVFGTLPHAPDASLDLLAELAERHLDLQGLWKAL
jgi:dethiobiotin synthetase